VQTRNVGFPGYDPATSEVDISFPASDRENDQPLSLVAPLAVIPAAHAPATERRGTARTSA